MRSHRNALYIANSFQKSPESSCLIKKIFILYFIILSNPLTASLQAARDASSQSWDTPRSATNPVVVDPKPTSLLTPAPVHPPASA